MTHKDKSPPHHTPGDWEFVDDRFIVAGDPTGTFPDIYIAEVAINDDEGRIAPDDQIAQNGWLLAAAPALLKAGEAVVAAWESGDLAAAVRALDDACAEARGQA